MRDALIERADELFRISSIELAQARSLREELRIARVTTANAIRELADVRLPHQGIAEQKRSPSAAATKGERRDAISAASRWPL